MPLKFSPPVTLYICYNKIFYNHILDHFCPNPAAFCHRQSSFGMFTSFYYYFVITLTFLCRKYNSLLVRKARKREPRLKKEKMKKRKKKQRVTKKTLRKEEKKRRPQKQRLQKQGKSQRKKKDQESRGKETPS